MNKSTTIIAAIGAATILTTLGIFAILQLANSAISATASHAEIEAIETVPLQGLSLDSGEFLLLADTTPADIQSGHVALNIPCEEDGDDTPTSDIALVAGVAPDVSAIELDYVADLSNPDDNRCTFHVTIPQDDEEITDVAIINTGDQTVEFESGNFATISLTAVDDDEDDGDEEEEDDDD